MTRVRWAALVAMLCGVVPLSVAGGDDKLDSKKKSTPAEDETRLVGKWSKSVKVGQEKWEYTFEFEKGGKAALHVKFPSGGGLKSFSYEVIDLRIGRRVIALTGDLVFPKDGILVSYSLGRDELHLHGGKDVLGADLKGKWKRVPEE